MTVRSTFKGLALAGAVSLLISSAALASPASDQYLPPAPGGAGGGGKGDSGSEGLSREEALEKVAAEVVRKRAANGTLGAEEAKGNDRGPRTAPELSGAPAAAPSDEDSGGGLDTLFDPVVLLLIAGVLAIAGGMFLARRHGSGGTPPDGPKPKRSAAPPTPDGEIVAGGGESQTG